MSGGKFHGGNESWETYKGKGKPSYVSDTQRGISEGQINVMTLLVMIVADVI